MSEKDPTIQRDKLIVGEIYWVKRKKGSWYDQEILDWEMFTWTGERFVNHFWNYGFSLNETYDVYYDHVMNPDEIRKSKQ